jgi:gamma-glutamyl:cysteine ligase YbdK (ATP-grasp superfamily)
MKFSKFTTTMMYRVMSVAAPVACLGVALGMSSYEMMHLNHLEKQIADTRAENKDARALLASIQKNGDAGFLCTAPDSRQEQVEFVNSIRKIADSCHVQLTQWAPSTASTLGVPDSSDEAAKDVLSKVQPTANQIGLSGSYADIRSFLLALQGQDRLVTVSSIKWIRAAKPPQTAIVMVVTRYIKMPAPLAKPSSPSSSSPVAAKS